MTGRGRVARSAESLVVRYRMQNPAVPAQLSLGQQAAMIGVSTPVFQSMRDGKPVTSDTVAQVMSALPEYRFEQIFVIETYGRVPHVPRTPEQRTEARQEAARKQWEGSDPDATNVEPAAQARELKPTTADDITVYQRHGTWWIGDGTQNLDLPTDYAGAVIDGCPTNSVYPMGKDGKALTTPFEGRLIQWSGVTFAAFGPAGQQVLFPEANAEMVWDDDPRVPMFIERVFGLTELSQVPAFYTLKHVSVTEETDTGSDEINTEEVNE